MKKYIVAAAAALLVYFGALAQDAAPAAEERAESAVKIDNLEALRADEQEAKKTQVITLTNPYPELHPSTSNVTVEINFIPLSDEVRIYYRCMAVSYKPGEAMNTVMACLQDFQKANGYYSYKYQQADKESVKKDKTNGMKMAEYYSRVKYFR